MEMRNVIHFTDFAGEELHIMYVRSHEDMKLVNTLGTFVKRSVIGLKYNIYKRKKNKDLNPFGNVCVSLG